MTNLIEKLKAVSEGSRELDAHIWCLTENFEFIEICDGTDIREIEGHLKFSHKGGQVYLGDKIQYFSMYPRYTTSVDAALTLVPKGWYWGVDCRGIAHLDPAGTYPIIMDGSPCFAELQAATPALALCIAILRAWNHS